MSPNLGIHIQAELTAVTALPLFPSFADPLPSDPLFIFQVPMEGGASFASPGFAGCAASPSEAVVPFNLFCCRSLSVACCAAAPPDARQVR